MRKNCVFILLWLPVLLACDEQPVQIPPENDSIFVVDTFDVKIIYEDIRGFLYPMMRHDVTFSGHRTTQGYIDFFGYKSDGVESQILLEYYGAGASAGTPFDFRNLYWSNKMTQVGGKVSYRFEAGSMDPDEMGDRIVRTGEAVIQPDAGDDAPVSNSFQLAGEAESWYGVAGVSAGGDQVYFLKRISGPEPMIARVPATGGSEEILVSAGTNVSAAVLDAGNRRLVLSSETLKNALLIYALETGTWDTLQVAAGFKASPLVALPEPGKIAVLTASTDPAELTRAAIIDLAGGEITPVTSLSIPVGHVRWLASVPGTNELALKVDGSTRIVAVDYTTNGVRTLLDDYTGGIFHVLTKEGRLVRVRSRDEDSGKEIIWLRHDNLFAEDGTSGEWLTRYLGRDALPVLSPDGRFFVFSSQRRGHYGIWRFDL